MTNIIDKYEHARGCGYRKEGGLYLVSGERAATCDRLPIHLHVCSTCGCGIKFSRGWKWINPAELFGLCPWKDDCKYKISLSAFCRIDEIKKAGLIWIGEKFYKSTIDFISESAEMGISRRIKAIPHDFKLGKTWVYLAHIKAYDNKEPGIFTIFKPQRIEYIIKGDETEKELEKMEKRRITLVRIHKKQNSLFNEN